MAKFVKLLRKGYLKQAETQLQLCNPDSKEFKFNQGLLALLQGNPELAVQLLEPNCPNAIAAKKHIHS